MVEVIGTQQYCISVMTPEELIVILAKAYPGNEVVVDLFEDVDGNTHPQFGDASKLSGDEYVGWLEGTRYVDGYERTYYQWMFTSTEAVARYHELVRYCM